MVLLPIAQTATDIQTVLNRNKSQIIRRGNEGIQEAVVLLTGVQQLLPRCTRRKAEGCDCRK